MKNFLLFILFVLFGIGLGLLYIWKVGMFVKKIPMANQKVNPELRFSIETPPSESKKGSIESITGDVIWDSRMATESVELRKYNFIQQGEIIETKENAKLTVLFQEIASINLGSKSKLFIVQTLPSNFVLSQEAGTIQYIRTGSTPLSIRFDHIVASMSKGDVKIAIDYPSIIFTINKGSAKIAFNDLQNISVVEILQEGNKYVYDDLQRTIEEE